jgi:hypothetical protein
VVRLLDWVVIDEVLHTFFRLNFKSHIKVKTLISASDLDLSDLFDILFSSF